jgi:hypothetical protein
MMKRVFLWTVVLGLCGTGGTSASEPGGDRPIEQSPYLRPEFRRLMDAVTFRVSFDGGSMAPDMAEGPKYAPSVHGSHNGRHAQPQFAPGLIGQALVLGTGGAVYPRAGNVLLERRGAIAMRVKPDAWQRPNDGNCVFAMTSNATFYLQRQGPLLDDDGRVRRHEAVMYLARPPEVRSATLTAPTTWENGRWYLLVANWSWPTLQWSINGEPFDVGSLSGVPNEGTFGDLVIGDRSGEPRGLIDEVIAFRRPLELAEVQLLREVQDPKAEIKKQGEYGVVKE